jgi:hypothetical protein
LFEKAIRNNILSFDRRYQHQKPRLAWRKWNSELTAGAHPCRTGSGVKMGRVGVRKRLMTDSKIQSGKTFLENGVPLHEVARNLGVSIPTLYPLVACVQTLLTSGFSVSLSYPHFDKQMKSLVNASPLKIRNLRATPVNVPLARPCSR